MLWPLLIWIRSEAPAHLFSVDASQRNEKATFALEKGVLFYIYDGFYYNFLITVIHL